MKWTAYKADCEQPAKIEWGLCHGPFYPLVVLGRFAIEVLLRSFATGFPRRPVARNSPACHRKRPAWCCEHFHWTTESLDNRNPGAKPIAPPRYPCGRANSFLLVPPLQGIFLRGRCKRFLFDVLAVVSYDRTLLRNLSFRKSTKVVRL
jgi:hypothetical protein